MGAERNNLGFHLLTKCLLTSGPQSKVLRETGLVGMCQRIVGLNSQDIPTDSSMKHLNFYTDGYAVDTSCNNCYDYWID